MRIRGWIEERGGPWVEAARPEQIEIVQKGGEPMGIIRDLRII